MRRAVIATVGTVAALVAILDYKSSGSIARSTVAVGSDPTVASGPTTSAPTTSAPTTSAPTTSAPTTLPSSSTSAGAAASVPTTTAPTTTTPTTTVSGQFNGSEVEYQYGDVEVRITVLDGRVTAITLPIDTASDPRSESINSQALPILTREALAAQSVHFDVVSGATYTSNAFAETLKAALSKAGK